MMKLNSQSGQISKILALEKVSGQCSQSLSGRLRRYPFRRLSPNQIARGLLKNVPLGRLSMEAATTTIRFHMEIFPQIFGQMEIV